MTCNRSDAGGRPTRDGAPPMHAALLIALSALAPAPQAPGKAAAPPQEAPPAPKPLDLEATERIVHAYDTAEGWTLKAMILLSLGDDFAPVGSRIALAALKDKDERLQPYALELIRRMEPEAATQVANFEL